MHFFRGLISWKYNFKPHQASRIKVAPKGLPPLLGDLWPRHLLSPYPSIHKIMSVLSFYFMLSEVGLHPAVNVCARFCATLACFFCPELFLQDWKATKVQATRKCLHQFVVCFIFCLFTRFFFLSPLQDKFGKNEPTHLRSLFAAVCKILFSDAAAASVPPGENLSQMSAFSPRGGANQETVGMCVWVCVHRTGNSSDMKRQTEI